LPTSTPKNEGGVSGDFYRVVGVNPFAGRTITAQDDTPACPSPSAVLSYAF
jgi:hypothetical protein